MAATRSGKRDGVAAVELFSESENQSGRSLAAVELGPFYGDPIEIQTVLRAREWRCHPVSADLGDRLRTTRQHRRHCGAGMWRRGGARV
jgi:hypothetical protein